MAERSTDSPKRDVYQEITDRIVAAIEAGTGPVEMPWHRSGVAGLRPVNVFSGQPYRGVNIVSLWAAASHYDFTSAYWATFNQWRCLGAQVRKGEKGSPIVFYKRYVAVPSQESVKPDESAGDDNPGDTERWFARTSWVFNVGQVDGWTPPQPPDRRPVEAIAGAEAFVAGTGAEIRHGGECARYRPSVDVIEMPERDAFTGTATSGAAESYYAVLFHELTHWSGHPSRLDRQLANRFGDAAYAMEELVAELGASFLCAACAIASAPRADHACYIASWLSALKNDKRAIFTAAGKASEATEFLIGLQSPDRVPAVETTEAGGS